MSTGTDLNALSVILQRLLNNINQELLILSVKSLPQPDNPDYNIFYSKLESWGKQLDSHINRLKQIDRDIAANQQWVKESLTGKKLSDHQKYQAMQPSFSHTEHSRQVKKLADIVSKKLGELYARTANLTTAETIELLTSLNGNIESFFKKLESIEKKEGYQTSQLVITSPYQKELSNMPAQGASVGDSLILVWLLISWLKNRWLGESKKAD